METRTHNHSEIQKSRQARHERFSQRNAAFSWKGLCSPAIRTSGCLLRSSIREVRLRLGLQAPAVEVPQDDGGRLRAVEGRRRRREPPRGRGTHNDETRCRPSGFMPRGRPRPMGNCLRTLKHYMTPAVPAAAQRSNGDGASQHPEANQARGVCWGGASAVVGDLPPGHDPGCPSRAEFGVFVPPNVAARVCVPCAGSSHGRTKRSKRL